MEKFNYNEQQRAFTRERKAAKQEYCDAMDELRAELKAKELKLRNIRDRKLDDICHRECVFVQQYREQKQQQKPANQ